MAVDPADQGARGGTAAGGRSRFGGEHHSTETKASYKTTELLAYIAVLIGILIASAVVDGDGNGGAGGGGDPFGADEAWRYITALTIGYMLARGLAKSGSREPYIADRGDR